jgi:glycosyltransferase involved in cell wall biosynthesis
MRNSRKISRHVIKNTLARSLGGLVLSEKLKCDTGGIIPEERLFVLQNAVPDIDLNKIQYDRDSSGPVQILFLSNLRPSKGAMEFLRMAKRILAECKRVRFTMAGAIESERFYQQIREFIYQEGLTDFVDFPGAVYGKDKDECFIRSHIFVLSSLVEAFPLVNLEAMQWGLPVVSSDVGSVSEMIHDGVNGYLVQPYDIDSLSDRVLRLIKNSDLRLRMGQAGRELYTKFFTIQAYEERLESAVYFFWNLKNSARRII